MKAGIVLNRMYVGSYLVSNLGHEVINLYQADNGGHYIYLNSTGDFVKAHQGRIGYMLFVKYYGKGEVEVIGKAEGLEDVYKADDKPADAYKSDPEIMQKQIDFIMSEGITYGGASILDIFKGSEQQNVFITYKAQKIYAPRSGRGIFIRFYNEKKESGTCRHEPGDVVISLEGYRQAKASLKQYIYPDGTYKGDLNRSRIEEKKRDYRNILDTLISNSSLWVEFNHPVDIEELNISSQCRVSLFDICQMQNDENKFSNALAYFMECPEYLPLWRNFFRRFGIELTEGFTVAREESCTNGGRIDLLVRAQDDLVVIENKIKSDINSIEEDGEGKQLRRYFDYVNRRVSRSDLSDFGKTIHYILLTPKYNIPVIEDKQMRDVYKVITYADLYDYLTENISVFKHDINFVSFYEAMRRHTHDNVNDYLFYEMQDKFIRRILAIDKGK